MSLLKNDSAKSLDSRVLAVFKKAKGLAIEANEKDNVLLYNRQEDLNDLLLMLRDLKISGVDVDSLKEREKPPLQRNSVSGGMDSAIKLHIIC